MEELIERIRTVLTAAFPNAQVDLEPSVPQQRVGGFLIWSGFRGQEQIDRQSALWKVLRRDLDRDDQSAITAILTMTPEEVAAATEG